MIVGVSHVFRDIKVCRGLTNRSALLVEVAGRALVPTDFRPFWCVVLKWKRPLRFNRLLQRLVPLIKDRDCCLRWQLNPCRFVLLLLEHVCHFSV